MKKLAAILLLGILLFNVYGYRVMLTYMDELATTRLEQRLDAGVYDENELVEVKIPLNLPYHNNWSDYETFYGQVNYDGEYYQYVKRKVANDTLYLLCIAHETKTKIHDTKNDHVRSMADVPMNGKNSSQGSLALKFMQSEFVEHFDLTNERVIVLQEKIHYDNYEASPNQFSPATPAQPPEFV